MSDQPAATQPPAPPAPEAVASPVAAPVDAAPPVAVAADPLRERVFDACKNVYDPEIPVNIFELGLIYDVVIDPQKNVKVIMTLTSPSCPSAQELPLEVRGRVAVLPGVNDVDVDVVFDPPWTPARMSEAAKVQLGFEL